MDDSLENSQFGKLSFQLNCQKDCINVLSSMAEVMAHRAGLCRREGNRVVLAVNELYANIVEHGYADHPGRVEFNAKVHKNEAGNDELHFDFRDYAEPLEDASVYLPCPSGKQGELKAGGLGVGLICSIMDVFRHEKLSDGNLWHLVYECHPDKNGVKTRGQSDEI